jgi:hypothetical protein
MGSMSRRTTRRATAGSARRSAFQASARCSSAARSRSILGAGRWIIQTRDVAATEYAGRLVVGHLPSHTLGPSSNPVWGRPKWNSHDSRDQHESSGLPRSDTRGHGSKPKPPVDILRRKPVDRCLIKTGA